MLLANTLTLGEEHRVEEQSVGRPVVPGDQLRREDAAIGAAHQNVDWMHVAAYDLHRLAALAGCAGCGACAHRNGACDPCRRPPRTARVCRPRRGGAVPGRASSARACQGSKPAATVWSRRKLAARRDTCFQPNLRAGRPERADPLCRGLGNAPLGRFVERHAGIPRPGRCVFWPLRDRPSPSARVRPCRPARSRRSNSGLWHHSRGRDDRTAKSARPARPLASRSPAPASPAGAGAPA